MIHQRSRYRCQQGGSISPMFLAKTRRAGRGRRWVVCRRGFRRSTSCRLLLPCSLVSGVSLASRMGDGRPYQSSLGTPMMGALSVVLPVALFSNSASTSSTSSLKLVALPRTKANRAKEQKNFFASARILDSSSTNQGTTMVFVKIHIMRMTRLLQVAKIINREEK